MHDGAPGPSGPYVFFDNFHNGASLWHSSSNARYTGVVATSSDRTGLSFPGGSKYYGLHSTFPKGPVRNDNRTLLIQYEVKLPPSLSCGGAYLKILPEIDFTLHELSQSSPYLIMFGPDFCFDKNLVWLILRMQNPATGAWEEKRLVDPPPAKVDFYTHLYTLVISPDNTFEIRIDEEVVRSGSLFHEFDPPVEPPLTISDPDDEKPADWVDDEFIDDPLASKPDDWDETLPQFIVDPKHQKPEGWLDDVPSYVPDPHAQKPPNWDDSEDGVWTRPMIPNPECVVGCGRWIPREIVNPNFRGRWRTPKIKNPSFVGDWTPRDIPNPGYFEIEDPYLLPRMAGIFIDIWQFDGGLQLDMILVTFDIDVAKELAEESFVEKSRREEELVPRVSAAEDTPDSEEDDYSLPFSFAIVLVIATTVLVCCRRTPPKHKLNPDESSKKKKKEKAD